MSTSSTSPSSSGRYYTSQGGFPSSMHEADRPLQAYLEHAMEGIEEYARNEPWAFAAWVFGIGFVLGWKLKPW